MKALSTKLVSLLTDAVYNKEVDFIHSGYRGGSIFVRFKWAGCTWEAEEYGEILHSINLVVGFLDNPDLTAEILKHKIKTS